MEGVEAVERIDNLNLYRVGSGLVMLASGVDANRSLAAVAAEELKALAAEAGETAALSVISGYSSHFIAEERPNTHVQMKDWVDTRLPMHLVAPGIVALASWPDEAIDNYLSRKLERPTDHSVVEADAFWERLQRVRQDGIAWTVDELEVGVTALSAPLIAASGEVVGGVNLHGPSFRFPGQRTEEFEKLVRQAAERINLLLMG